MAWAIMLLKHRSIFGLFYPLPSHSLFINQGLVIKGSQLVFVSSCFWFTHSSRRKSSCCKKNRIHNSLTARSVFRAAEAAMGTDSLFQTKVNWYSYMFHYFGESSFQISITAAATTQKHKKHELFTSRVIHTNLLKSERNGHWDLQMKITEK